MSAELSGQLDGWESVRSALGEIRACHADFEHFFGDVCNQLGALSGELAGRQTDCLARQAQAQGGEGPDRPAEVDHESQQRLQQLLEQAEQDRAELHGVQRSVQEQLEQLAVVADELAQARNGDGHDRPSEADEESQQRLQQLLERAEQDRAELQAVQQSVHEQLEQLAVVADELTQARSNGQASRDGDEEGQQEHEQLLQQCREMEQQQTQLELERRELELELESIRNRAAEMTESLAEQKRLGQQQQAQWAQELKRMRRLLEKMSGMLLDREAVPAETAVPPPALVAAAQAVAAEQPAAAADDDPVLDSVMAQFEMLQRDLARRRASVS